MENKTKLTKSKNSMTSELPQQSILQKGTFVFEDGLAWE